MKIAPNCLSLSAPGEGKRYLWDNGSHLAWQLIRDLFNHDLEARGKGTNNTIYHVNLNSYSRMTVNYVAQVLGETVRNI